MEFPHAIFSHNRGLAEQGGRRDGPAAAGAIADHALARGNTARMTSYFFTRATLVTSLALSAGAVHAQSNPLEGERWKTRPVVVVAAQAGDPLLTRLRAALEQTAAREAFRERDMVLYTVVAGEGRRNDVPLGAAQTAALLQALELDARGPSSFVLVGKDGGVKLREGAAVDLQEVFAEVDRMPMRQPR